MIELESFHSVEQVVTATLPHDSIMCFRPHILAAQARYFRESFAGDVLFAMKCNPEPALLSTLYNAGITAFDTASITEIAEIRTRFPDAQVYFHHPVKSRTAIRRAYYDYGVRYFVVDHAAELAKLRGEIPNRDVTVGVRLATPAGHTAIHLSEKFGASPGDAVALLQDIRRAGLKAGLAFHVGSLCRAPDNFDVALRLAGSVLADVGGDVAYLNVGGGFPVNYPGVDAPALSDFLTTLHTGIRRLSLPAGCKLMCEPGRALAASSVSLLTQIILCKDRQLYLSDGLYGTLADMHYTAGIRYPVRLVRQSSPRLAAEDLADYTIFGPTCDSIDTLPLTFRLPADVQEGDWLEIDQLGAYSTVLATNFNGFGRARYVQVEDMPFSAETAPATAPQPAFAAINRQPA